jgi:hypothetical protein
LSIAVLDYHQKTFQSDNGSTRIRGRDPFPSGTKAFLYYFIPPEKPRIAGELRLRVTSSNDPASFESGSDLLRPNGRQPWSRPLFILQKCYPPLYEKLREEGLVPDDLNRKLFRLSLKDTGYCFNRRRLYTLNDTFIIDFSTMAKGSYFFVVTEKGIKKLRIHQLFVDSRKKCKGKPFTGAHSNLHLSLLLY